MCLLQWEQSSHKEKKKKSLFIYLLKIPMFNLQNCAEWLRLEGDSGGHEVQPPHISGDGRLESTSVKSSTIEQFLQAQQKENLTSRQCVSVNILRQSHLPVTTTNSIFKIMGKRTSLISLQVNVYFGPIERKGFSFRKFINIYKFCMKYFFSCR